MREQRDVHWFGAPGAVLDRPVTGAPGSYGIAVPATSQHFSQVKVSEGANGSKILQGIRIFKMGTFADSMGIVRTWEGIHLDAMVAHFHLLRDNGYLPHIPVRVDHSFSLENVVGYFVDVYRDRTDDNFLAADIEITEPDAYAKWERGTFRSRSLEVGHYVTNDDKEYWPVVMGLAFVDLPAVEGLHGSGQSKHAHFRQPVVDDLGGHVNAPDINTHPDEWIAAVTYAAWLEAATYAQACDDWSRAATYAQALADEAARQTAQPDPATGAPAPANHAQGTQPATGTPAVPATLTYRVNGEQISEFARIQAHIDMLEQFRTETIIGGRSAFVDELAHANKISAPQIDSLKGLVATMDDAQFAAFKASYDAAPPASLFGTPGLTPGADGGGVVTHGSPDAGGVSEVDTLREMIATHKRAGKSNEFIKGTVSYQRLVALDPTAALA